MKKDNRSNDKRTQSYRLSSGKTEKSRRTDKIKRMFFTLFLIPNIH